MAHLVEKKLKRGTYYYLATTIRTNGKTRKIQVYVGPRKPSPSELARYTSVLKKRVEDFGTKTDPLKTMIPEKEIRRLEKAKKWYKKLSTESSEVRENYYEWFTTTYTYDTNAIEGSTLNLRETAMILFEGISPQNKPLRDVLAAQNHKKAFDFILGYRGDINKQLILKLHKILTTDILEKERAGNLRKVQVYIRGSETLPPGPQDVPSELARLIKWYKSNKKKYHPAILASYFHCAFEGIHPFVDFNGRSGRLLLNFILLKNGYPPIDIRNKGKWRYYEAIRSALKNDLRPFVDLVVKYLKPFTK